MSRKSGTEPLHEACKPKLIAQVDQKKGGVNTVVMTNYKADKHEVPVASANGSTVPLVDGVPNNGDEESYDPFANREVSHPTSDCDTLIHLLKGSLGSGILAMPMAFANSGLFAGLVATIAVGSICTYCVHILVKSAHTLLHRNKVPMLGYAEVGETAFLCGPRAIRPWAKFAKAMINLFLVIDLLGCCCCYILFVSENVKQVVDNYTPKETHQDIKIYMAGLLPFLIAINLVRNLKYLAPLSMVANLLVASGMGITYYYLISEIRPISSVPGIVSLLKFPKFFGTAIFAMEGIGVVMPLENNMKTPTHFIGCPGVLNIGMAFVVTLYTVTGFLGYLRYGNDTLGSITLNLPQDEVLGQSVKIMIALAIFCTYALQFYVPMEIIWKSFKGLFHKRPNLYEYAIRISLVTLTVVIAILVPDLEGFVSLVGSLCLSGLGLIFPSVIELVTYYETPGLKWRLPKNIFLICFGILGLTTGTYVSIQGILEKSSS